MVGTLFVQGTEGVSSILDLSQELTITGLLLLGIFALVWYIKSLEKKHKETIKDLKSDLKYLQDKLDTEFEKSTEDYKLTSKNYHVFTTKMIEIFKSKMDDAKSRSDVMMEKMNTILNEIKNVQTRT